MKKQYQLISMLNKSYYVYFVQRVALIAIISIVFFFAAAHAEASSLRLSPSTGVYTSGSTFTVQVQVDTAGKPINAAEGTLTFNPRELSVVSVNRSSSIFNLWVTEPAFSNSNGTVSFSGGVPSGYAGAVGQIMSVTFRSLGTGSPRVAFSSGSILANDGRGTNVLTAMNGGTYTISPVTSEPVPEVVEYIPQANTPAAPVITSSTHPDQNAWYKTTEAVLNWELPAGITAVRTALDDSPSTIPTRVYDTPIRTITLSDLEQGVSYFHLQFQNAEGWGRVAHYRLAVDTEKPSELTIALAEDADLSSPVQTLRFSVTDSTSRIIRYLIKVNANEPIEFLDTEGTAAYTLTDLSPGYQTVIVEAFDEAGNSVINSLSFTISAFEKPIFTTYPSEINEEVIPVIKGTTRPNATVSVSVRRVGSEPVRYTVVADGEGVFTFIPDGTFSTGVYELSAVATDSTGAISETSDTIKIAVQQPGYVRVGSFLINLLSVVIPLMALVVLMVVGSWFLLLYVRRLRSTVAVESVEAAAILKREFSALHKEIELHAEDLLNERKNGKLTKAEAEMVEALTAALKNAERRVEKEITDVTNVVKTRK